MNDIMISTLLEAVVHAVSITHTDQNLKLSRRPFMDSTSVGVSLCLVI